MEFYITARTYNRFGGHRTLSLISDFLLDNTGDFGPAISELTLNFHFAHKGPPRSTLESKFDDFHANLQKLPKVVFRRNRGQATIDIPSELIEGKELEKVRSLSLELFNAAIPEAISAIKLLRKRINAKDNFDLEKFLASCNEAQARLPSTVEELEYLEVESKKKRLARNEAMSEWEKLSLDWRDFHPDARTILDDPFFWDCSNDFAPNGNDTGADLLEDYRSWLKRNPSGDPIRFLDKLIKKWGYPSNPLSDPDDVEIRDEATVALAFAEFKFRANCRPAVAVLAREAIQRQRQRAIDATGWSHREERLKSLDLLEAKLASIA